MALSDIYSQAPWTPMSGMNTDVGDLANGPQRVLQRQAQEQANRDAAYTSPSAPASDHRQFLGRFVQEHLMAGPPEFQDKLRQELSQGGLNAQYMPQGNMVEQVPQRVGGLTQPQYQSYNPEQSLMGSPQPRPVDVSTGSMPGQGGQPVQSPDVQVQNRRPLNASLAFAMDRNPPAQAPQGVQAPKGPMTNYDVDSYMKASGMIQKPTMKGQELEEKKREFDAMMDYRNRALGMKDKLAKLAADAKMANNDNDRKRAIELLRIEVEREKAGIAAKAHIMGGLYGIVDSEGTQAYLKYLDSFVTEAEGSIQGAENQPGMQPIQTMGGAGKPKGPPMPRHINEGKPDQYTVGQTYDMTGPEFPKEWNGKARFKGYDAQKNARWGRP